MESSRVASAREREAARNIRLPGLHPLPRSDPIGTVDGASQDPRQRMTVKLKELRRALRRRMHAPVRKQQVWLDSVLRSHLCLVRHHGKRSQHRPVPHRSPAGLAVRADAPGQPQPNVLSSIPVAIAPVPRRPGENPPCLALPLKHIGPPSRGEGHSTAALNLFICLCNSNCDIFWRCKNQNLSFLIFHLVPHNFEYPALCLNRPYS